MTTYRAKKLFAAIAGQMIRVDDSPAIYERRVLGGWAPSPRAGDYCEYEGPGKTRLPCQVLAVEDTDRGTEYTIEAVTVRGDRKTIKHFRGNLYHYP